jgi:hypothetical protein
MMLPALGDGGGPGATGQSDTSGPSQAASKKLNDPGGKKADDPAIMAALEDLRVFRFAAVAAVAIPTVGLLAVIGLYFRRVRLVSLPEPYDDRRLTEEIAQLRGEVSRFSKQLATLLSTRETQPAAIVSRPSPTPVQERSPDYDSTSALTEGEPVSLGQDYQQTRSSRASWKAFEARNSSERFECINVRERLSRPEESPRFESSTSGAYLAVPTGDGKYSVFPFFSANPWQLSRDGAMSEVYDFPSGQTSGSLNVLKPAVFIRRDSQWILQERGRLGQ